MKIYYESSLYHHGILGQKWGKKNGPPYPLKIGQMSTSEKENGGGGGGLLDNMEDKVNDVKKQLSNAELQAEFELFKAQKSLKKSYNTFQRKALIESAKVTIKTAAKLITDDIISTVDSMLTSSGNTSTKTKKKSTAEDGYREYLRSLGVPEENLYYSKKG